MNFVGEKRKEERDVPAGLVQRVEHLSFVLGLQSFIPFAMYWPNVQPRGSLTRKDLTVSKI